jgi:hypothetical protein
MSGGERVNTDGDIPSLPLRVFSVLLEVAAGMMLA